MRKQALLLLLFWGLALAGCIGRRTPTLAPGRLTSTPAVETPTQTVPTLKPSETALPPSETPVVPTETAAATATAAAPATSTPEAATEAAPTPSGPVIAHFAAGQAFAVTYIQMNDATTGWALGGQGAGSRVVGDHVLKTSDGGLTWSDVTPPEPMLEEGAQLQALAAFKGTDTAWVTYYRSDYFIQTTAVVWRTDDGGSTWKSSQSLDVSGLSELYLPSELKFVGDQNGWLLAHVGAGMNHDYVVLFRTRDGGQSWERLIDPSYNDGGIQSCSKTALLFVDPQTGWLTGDCNGVAAGVLLSHTSDGGETWQDVSLPVPPSAPNIFSDNASAACGSYDPQFSSPQNGKLVVRCRLYNQDPPKTMYFQYTTRDGGGTWSVGDYPGGTLLMLDDATGWALGQTIYQTTDSGATWTKMNTVSWEAQFSFVSSELGWAVARSEEEIAMVSTSNGGKKWDVIHPVVK